MKKPMKMKKAAPKMKKAAAPKMKKAAAPKMRKIGTKGKSSPNPDFAKKRTIAQLNKGFDKLPKSVQAKILKKPAVTKMLNKAAATMMKEEEKKAKNKGGTGLSKLRKADASTRKKVKNLDMSKLTPAQRKMFQSYLKTGK